MLDKHCEISLLDKQTKVMGKEYGEKVSSNTRMVDPMRQSLPIEEHSDSLVMEKSTLWWTTNKKRQDMEEVSYIGEVLHTEKSS